MTAPRSAAQRNVSKAKDNEIPSAGRGRWRRSAASLPSQNVPLPDGDLGWERFLATTLSSPVCKIS